MVKNSRAIAAASGDTSLIPGLGRCPGVGTGNPLQYSCLGNPMERGDCQPTVHGAARSWTQMSMQAHGVSIHKFNDLFVGRISAWLLLWLDKVPGKKTPNKHVAQRMCWASHSRQRPAPPSGCPITGRGSKVLWEDDMLVVHCLPWAASSLPV